MVVMMAIKVRFRLKHEGTAPTQRPSLTSVEVRTHPDAQPRFPLFSSVTNHNCSKSASALNEWSAYWPRTKRAGQETDEFAYVAAVVSCLGL